MRQRNRFDRVATTLFEGKTKVSTPIMMLMMPLKERTTMSKLNQEVGLKVVVDV